MLAVTGITGHSGRYFYQELVNFSYSEKIRCLVRDSSNTSFLQNNINCELYKIDLKSEADLIKAFTGIDTIVHIAGISYTPKIVRAAIKCGVKRLIAVHTTGRYSKFKSASEEYIKVDNDLDTFRNQIAITILRPTMIYGDLCDHNMSKFIKMVDKLKLYPNIAGGQCKIQPVHAGDLGKAYYQVLTNGNTMGKDYILSGESPIALIDCLKEIEMQLNKKNIYITVPMWLAKMGSWMIYALSFKKIDLIEKVLRMNEDRCFDHSDASIDFGYKPRSFENGIKEEVKQYKGE